MHASSPLDPIGFRPAWKSRILGIGGSETPGYPEYIFHTGFLEYGAGRARWDLSIDQLDGVAGSMTLRLDALPRAPGGRVETVLAQEIDLGSLMAAGGKVSITADVRFDRSYALMGLAREAITGSAKGVILNRYVEGFSTFEAPPSELASALSTVNEKLSHGSMLTSLKAPSFSDPVSQPFTIDQTMEPPFVDWLAKLGAAISSKELAWSLVYPLHCFKEYDVLRPAARVLMLEPPSARSALLARTGCRLYWPFCDQLGWTLIEDGSGEEASHGLEQIWAAPESLATLPTGFDMMIAPRNLTSLLARLNLSNLLGSACGCLRSGGVAVLDLALIDAREQLLPRGGEIAAYTHHEIDRVAVVMISKGLQVAECRYPKAEPRNAQSYASGEGRIDASIKPFALVVRRP